MKTTVQWALAAGFLTWTFVASGVAAQLLSPNDFIIAIDTDSPVFASNYPGGEEPSFVLDSDSATKYLNFAEFNTGFIVSPFTGSTVVKSIQLTTANDAEERDPTGWKVYGTNEFVNSLDNEGGAGENWTLIAEDSIALPAERSVLAPVQSFANSTAYSSYKVLFPTVKDPDGANSMQIADVNLFTTSDGSGFSVWDPFDTAIAFGPMTPAANYPANEGPEKLLDGNGPIFLPTSSYPDGEAPGFAVDGTLAKYLNFGGENSGFIVTPSGGPSQVQSFQLTTANDAVERDPASWELYGTSNAIESLDNSTGVGESWVLIDSGTVALPTDRDTLGPVVSVSNASSYSSYKMLFPTLSDAATANSMQIAEASFYLSTDGSGTDVLNLGDPILAVATDITTGTATKYLNFGKENGGFIVTPFAGPTVVTEFQVTTANDQPSRDPATWELYGTNEAIVSEDLSQGDGENWVLIDSGTFDLASVPEERETEGGLVSVTNSNQYASYRMVFPTIRETENEGANSLQLAGIQFFGDVLSDADFDGDGDIDSDDFLTWQLGNGLTGQSSNVNGDANLDGVVDAADRAIWESQFGAVTPAGAGAAVPEPSTLAMLVVFSMMGVSASGRRRASA